MIPTEQLNSIVGRIKKLPVLPAEIERINRMIDDAHYTVEEVGREIAKEQSLSAQVLQLVNSSFYGFSNRVSSIPHAAVLLGLRVLRNMVSGAWVSGLIQKSLPGLYDHSLACARTCFVVSRTLGGEEPEEMSTIGLLHDIGKVVLAQYLPDNYASVDKLMKEKGVRFVEAEREVLRATHADLGQWLLKKWNLPAATVDPIGQHHDFQASSPRAKQAAILIIADTIVRAEGIGWSGDGRLPAWNPKVMESLKLAPGDIRGLMDEVYQQIRDLPRHGGTTTDARQ